MNTLIDKTQAEETDRRPGDGARELNVLVVAPAERSIEQVDALVSRVRERFAVPISWAGGSRSIAA